jgi:hypothetical protein
MHRQPPCLLEPKKARRRTPQMARNAPISSARPFLIDGG